MKLGEIYGRMESSEHKEQRERTQEISRGPLDKR